MLRSSGRARGGQRARRLRVVLFGRRHVRPLRPGDRRRDHAALRVPDALHPLPARGLPGRPAGDVRVPDRDLRADRAARRQRLPVRGPVLGRLRRLPGDRGDQGAAKAGRLAWPSPAQPRDASHLRRGLRRRDRRGGAGGRRHRRGRARRRRRLRDRGRLRAEPQLPRRRGGSAGAGGHGEGGRGPDRRHGGSADARRPAGSGRVWRRHRARRGAAPRWQARLRRPFVRVLRRHLRAPAPDARPDRGRDHGCRRAPGLRPRPADARAAHPSREGDPQHLHLTGAERPGGRRLPGVAGQAGHRRARRADGPAHRLRARAPGGARRRRAPARRPRGAGVRGAAGCARGGGAGPNQQRRDRRRLPARPRVPRARGRAARRDHGAALEGGHRPPDGFAGAGACGGG